MTIRQAIKGLAGVFKPGYPTGRNEYMVLDSGRDEAFREFSRRGICAVRCCCGYDYNYHGSLYHLETTNKERTRK